MKRKSFGPNRLIYAGAASFVCLVGGLWSKDFLNNTNQQDLLVAEYIRYSNDQEYLSPTNDDRNLLPMLNTLYAATQVYANRDKENNYNNFGLDQSSKIDRIFRKLT